MITTGSSTSEKKSLCPECETKAYLATMELTPELLEELSLAEPVTEDTVLQETYNSRLAICKNCARLIGNMTCAECGCFVQFRAKRKTAFCAMGKW